MRSLQDTLYNWLTIKVVADARPDDHAANETYELFTNILKDDHKVENVQVLKEDPMYYVLYTTEQGENKKVRFPMELIDVMIDQINNEPEKYTNYPK
ncbi:hypothetical protein ACWE42_00900 [Sutcliffiella cohnii]|uniref:Uncharacterized protein n=1 Tax=Sutcliffiella cohnii TaxID=33932 RepID=A0A223KRZ0_9BACI|nr:MULTISPECIES: hypothetical protein [Sutcliffiella]AST92196.1 hypothetical protein BC6307_13330 [Sutcliffiella cohnii]MED4015485.1 hypothetical protein [Sutcliffiella cohnii]WBL13429.1 hypothetical protein O1A01_16050 [Sutcliffiella sp. NC1]